MSAPNFTIRVDFSHEDKAAKGLRSLSEPMEAPEPPLYFTAREMVAMYPRLLLLGGRGSGKTRFARQLAAETGATYLAITGPETLRDVPAGGPLILDGIDRLGPNGHDLLTRYLAPLGERSVLLLGDGAVVRGWSLPSGYALHSLLPLSLEERQAYLSANGIAAAAAVSDAAANPALFALALSVDTDVTGPEHLIDLSLGDNAERAKAGFDAIAAGRSSNRAVDDLLAARHLATLDLATVAGLFLGAPDTWTASVESLLRRAPEVAPALKQLLIQGDSDAALRGALLVATDHADAAVADKLLALITSGRLSAFDRDRAARRLAVWSDPRDLEALCAIAGGQFTMGSDSHPNSRPVHQVTVAPFQIGRYPVTNALYSRFVAATGRKWVSPEAGVTERANAPATDVTWHDARAYCAWLTQLWQQDGRIGADEIVRLPTEPEWERASRGDQPDGGAQIVYPWGHGWNSAAANSEETGFNAPCAVGLFPAGVSPYGCYDMAGQVWEWTTTLWGDDMAVPAYPYPYADDGREAIDAGPSIRRVLRGGCFSSTSLKACCSYRGSLEPDGFWRGNGFRIVLSRLAAQA